MGYSGFAIYRLLKENIIFKPNCEKYVVLFILLGEQLNDVNRLVEAIKDIDQIEVDQVFDEDFLLAIISWVWCDLVGLSRSKEIC